MMTCACFSYVDCSEPFLITFVSQSHYSILFSNYPMRTFPLKHRDWPSVFFTVTYLQTTKQLTPANFCEIRTQRAWRKNVNDIDTTKRWEKIDTSSDLFRRLFQAL